MLGSLNDYKAGSLLPQIMIALLCGKFFSLLTSFSGIMRCMCCIICINFSWVVTFIEAEF